MVVMRNVMQSRNGEMQVKISWDTVRGVQDVLMQWEGTGEVTSAPMHALVNDAQERFIWIKEELKGFYDRQEIRKALERNLES